MLSIADPQQGRARGGILMRQVRTHLSNPPPGVSNGVLPSRGASGGTVMYLRIEADYLVIGAGATAMAFVDTL